MLAACFACAARIAYAQSVVDARERQQAPLFVNDEWERYARIRQIAGDAPYYPWTVRAFGARESDSVALEREGRSHPWRHRESVTRIAWLAGRIRVTPLPARFSGTFNSDFPFGFNDGSVWAGRGLTTALSGGLTARAEWGGRGGGGGQGGEEPRHRWRGRAMVTLTLAPEVFRAENRSFDIMVNGLSGVHAYGDPFEPGLIDHPQRFGEGAYQRLAPGNSTLDIEAYGMRLGLSTANQHWGPARDHPLVLGNNAPGFPHVFVGTSRPTNVFIGRVHGRLVWGRLDASAHSGAAPTDRYRFATGIATLLEPRGVPGLELGFARFFHIRWEPGVVNWANASRPFIGIVREFRQAPSGNPIGDEPDNQIASLFGRWAHPRSGFEVYGEFAKDDYNGTMRDLAGEPDHMAGYLLGLQRASKRDSTRYTVFRAEVLNTRIGPLAASRPEYRFYIHTRVLEGHTHEGQVLGSPGAFGGGAFVVALDRYSPTGRNTVAVSRMLRAEYLGPSGLPENGRADLYQMVTLDGVRFRGSAAITYEITGVLELNRHFARDAFNLRAATGVQFAW